MPLSIEAIGTSADGNRLISLCHYGEQNGDLMRDPEMVFELFTHGEASACRTAVIPERLYGRVSGSVPL